MRSTVLAFLLLSARGGVAALAAWLVAGPCAAPMRPVGSYAGCGWP